MQKSSGPPITTTTTNNLNINRIITGGTQLGRNTIKSSSTSALSSTTIKAAEEQEKVPPQSTSSSSPASADIDTTVDNNNNNNSHTNFDHRKNQALDNTVSYADFPPTITSVEVEVEENNTKTGVSALDKGSHQHLILRLPPTKKGIESSNNGHQHQQEDNQNTKMTPPGTSVAASSSGGDVFSEEDRKFLNRIRASVKTVQNWDNNTGLFQECRSVIPWDDLKNETGPYSRPDHDWIYYDNPDALFLQRLCRWFPTFMSWVNAPPCRICDSKECEMKTVRSPITEEEKDGEAKRVEVYYCPDCKENTTTFPRYNKASKLLETRKGRCGEYSNLFGLFCRSVGYETRLVLDLSDHLWTEVRLPNGRDDTWVMADACEGVIDQQSMYEHGWGKDSLCYMIGIGNDHVVDVTPRYTRQYLTDDFQSRRRQHTSSEETSEQLLKRVNFEIEQNKTISGLPPTTKARKEELERRSKIEQAELQNLKQRTEWTEQEKYGRGRMSGSLQWRRSRGEIQDANTRKNDDVTPQDVAGFEVEAFVPTSQYSENGKVVFRLQAHPSSRYGGIEVSGAPCAIGEKNSVSVVVVDEKHMGTILQSKSCVSWSEVTKFIDTIPPNRIVLMNGKIENNRKETKPDQVYTEVVIDRLGGWDGSNVARDGVLFAGQVDAHPDWTFCSSISNDENERGYEVELSTNSDDGSLPSLSLRTERASVPQRVAGRLPEAFLPLHRQLQASDEDKRSAYLAFIGKNRNHRYSGYTTKKNCPVYLLNSTSFPLHRMDETTISTLGRDSVWNTFLSLPPSLVPDGDQGIVESQGPSRPVIDVPMDVSFFKNSLGPSLLSDSATRLPTENALSNARLIGLYFSASWCGPCRQFTPMLAEMYEHLSDTNPTNGFEIVFVSSDRDLSSFENYYSKQPWKAIPFDHLQLVQQMLNMTYNVRGIPSLVILDAVSGSVVVPASQSRQEVVSACHGGERSISRMFDSWLERVPLETDELIKMLEMSVNEDSAATDINDLEDHPYLRRPIHETDNVDGSESNKDDLAAQVKKHFERLMKSGDHDPNSAAARALSLASGGAAAEPQPSLPAGDLNGKATYQGPIRVEDPVDVALVQALEWNSPPEISNVLLTAQKYLKNVIEKPWEPRFRTFRLSNKVADSITSVEGGLGLLQSLGFEVVVTSHDFKATIPVPNDPKAMEERISQLIDDIHPSIDMILPFRQDVLLWDRQGRYGNAMA
eukprot:CAMPEP_0113452064 /NCGR_PEP_ID=MMETSP0014_2-20120614/6657_1 /TAXON_ID=2857 /ORGANISM="Nitzschia sp." /LENGTH=1224 /DNA_ID=CAMNT_0000343431 /DNA_START=191 /DNA_END=3866 /DNA_ORIENTATION=- /assembly_acc=CAM_ASM_000159